MDRLVPSSGVDSLANSALDALSPIMARLVRSSESGHEERERR